MTQYIRREEFFIDDAKVIQYFDENGLFHREGGPASVRPSGTQVWFRHGFKHREDGPAMLWDDGTISYYLKGVQYTFGEWLDEVTQLYGQEYADIMKLKWAKFRNHMLI